MDCLFKLIDDNEKNDIEKTRTISLSRPLLEFGLPEGLIIDFFREIYSILKPLKEYNLISPSPEILDRITEWYKTYLDTFLEVYKTQLSVFLLFLPDCDDISERLFSPYSDLRVGQIVLLITNR